MNSSSLLEAMTGKAVTVERCIARARQERAASGDFVQDFTRQDAAMMNVQRACEAVIDMANMAASAVHGRAPESTREAFELLRDDGIVPDEDAAALLKMVGFRNIAVHAYRNLDLSIVERVIQTELDTLSAFAGRVLAHFDRQKR